MYTAISRYYRFKLSTEQKQIYYDVLLAGMERRETEIHTKPFLTEDFEKILHALNFDNPQLIEKSILSYREL